jgi:hypothetical protein
MLEYDRLTRATDGLTGPGSNLYLTESDQRVYAMYPPNKRAGRNAYIASEVLNILGFTSTKLQPVDNGMVALDAPPRKPGLYVDKNVSVSRLHGKSIVVAAWLHMRYAFYSVEDALARVDLLSSPFDDSYHPRFSQLYLDNLFRTFDTGPRGAHKRYLSVPLYKDFLDPRNRTLPGVVYKGVDDSVIQEALDMRSTLGSVRIEDIIRRSGLDGGREREYEMKNQLGDIQMSLP